jgi:hypothetical protein
MPSRSTHKHDKYALNGSNDAVASGMCSKVVKSSAGRCVLTVVKIVADVLIATGGLGWFQPCASDQRRVTKLVTSSSKAVVSRE